jgi:hypothetical protein
MYRRAAVLILALVLNPALLHAQDTVLTVTVPSADVHKGPSTVTPIIGHVSRGTVLSVTRNLGSWAKVAWPDAPDGVAYLHVTTGRLGLRNTDARAASTSSRASSAPTGEPAFAPAPVPLTQTPAAPRVSSAPVAVSSEQGGTRHVLGVGGLVGSMSSFGATVRAWRKDRLGVQVALTREVMTNDVTADRVRSMQVEPGVVYELLDKVTDYVWFRPYVGSGLTFSHQTLTPSVPATMEPASSNGVGFRVFGGTELTFAGMTRFAVGAELGYRRFPAPFAGFEPDRLGMSIVGHWYVK